MKGLLQDIRYAFRQLGKSPGFTAVAVLTLTLGIGATTAVFSVVYGVLLKPLPYADPDRIVSVFEIEPNGRHNRLADPNFDDFRDQSHSFQAIAKYSAYIAAVSGGSEPTRSIVAHVTPQFLRVFRVNPIIGRDLVAENNTRGGEPVALVSYGYWKQYLGSSLDLSQLHLKIDDALFSVVGVLPDGFQFPAEATIWIPADLKGENSSRSSHNFNAVARLRDNVTIGQANAEISAMGRRIYEASNDKGDFLLKDAGVVALQDSITGETRPSLLILLVAVGFLLLVACANVANLRLAQASVREREIAVRSALGAPRRRLVRQFVTEAFVLSLLGGGAGLISAYLGVSGLLALAAPKIPRLAEVSINLPVLAFALLVCSGVAIGIGVFTALRATAGNVRKKLAEGSREQASSRASQKMGRSIVAAQIAITLVLVVGAGLLGRSLMKVLAVKTGFRVEKIVTMDVSLPRPDWTDWKLKADQATFFRNLIERLRRIPGVRQVGATSDLPMTGWVSNGQFLLMSQNELPKTPTTLEELSHAFDILFGQKERLGGEADFCVATGGYFRALGIPLIRGRMFDERDGPDAPNASLISASLAQERWPGQDPIGRTIEFGNMDGDIRLLTIVGVVGDVRNSSPEAPPQPTVYVNLFQRPEPAMTLTILSDADTQQVTSAARQILSQMNPDIPPLFRTFSKVYSESIGSRRFNVTLITLFAGIALMLAMGGVFGVMAYSVSRRTREIGVRVALGARSADVVSMVLRQGLRTILVGIVIGVAGALALTRAIQSLLFGVSASDPLTFCAVVVLLLTIALLACYIPARRAAKVDPIVALRYE
jgi:putative ABC transport system permease protein